MIEKSVVEEVLSRSNIEDVVSPYVSLRRAGSLIQGLCPFHGEKSPSFYLYPRDNSFYCFGCGAGGDVITFIRRIENMEFEDAVEVLAKRVGINVVRTERDAPRGPHFDRAHMLEMNREAARFFHARLFDATPSAEAARRYLTEKRGLSMSVIKHFGLGYAPDNLQGFIRYFLDKGYTYDELCAGFLLGRSEHGNGYYLSFRDRVMFPVIDVVGNVIAFSGRVVEQGEPKYKNSSDTPVFKKSKNLYGLNFARNACTDALIICEGNLDVIAMHAAGVTNSVATLGTSITPEHARMIARYTKKVILSYDSDEAGQKATIRALALLEQAGLVVQVLKIEGAKDPDEYIRRFGVDSFRRLIDASNTKFEFNLNRILSRHDISQPQEKIIASKELCELISGFYSSAEREIYIAEVARRLEIDPGSIRNDVSRAIARKKKEEKRDRFEEVAKGAYGYGDRINPDRARAPAVAGCEDAVLGLLLLFPEHRKAARGEAIALTEDDFFTAFSKRVAAFLLEPYNDMTVDYAEMNERFTPDEIGRITALKVKRMDLSDNGEGAFRESVEALRAILAKQKVIGSEISSLTDLEALIRARREEGNH